MYYTCKFVWRVNKMHQLNVFAARILPDCRPASRPLLGTAFADYLQNVRALEIFEVLPMKINIGLRSSFQLSD